MQLTYIRDEIRHMRQRVVRQRKEIQQLQRDGIPTKSAEELLARMQVRVDQLCAERDRLIGEISQPEQSHQRTD